MSNKESKANETLGCGGLDAGECLESGTDNRKSADV